jgi:photosystem II stability/assembly factor-like uncharacterized protein
MSESDAEPVTYLDFSYDDDRNWLQIASRYDRLNEQEDEPQSRTSIVMNDGQMTMFPLEGMLVTSAVSTKQALWAIGQGGELWTYAKGQEAPFEDWLPDSGTRGPRKLGRPERIRLIEQIPYVCGNAGQVYALTANGWAHMDKGIVEPEATPNSVTLTGIHGTAADFMYVVGSKGTLAHWNGMSWTKQTLPITSTLSGVRVLSPKEIFAVGDGGVFVELRRNSWKVEAVKGFEGVAFSDVESFEGRLYIAAGDKLLVREGTAWQVVDTFPAEAPQFSRLTTGGGRLWAMGPKRVHSFDGKNWVAYVDPDNL